jgi:uncharacterized protein (DUF58 family)
VSPTPRLAAGVALVAVVAVFAGGALAIAVLVVLLAATVVDARATSRPPAVERRFPTWMARGLPVAFTVVVGVRPGRGVCVRQALPDGLVASSQEAGGALQANVTGTRRARHEIPPVAVRVTGPLGLARRDHRCCGPLTVEVVPDVVTAYRTVDVRALRAGDAGRLVGPRGIGTEFESVREWSPDDDIRVVNWRATARVGRPMANQHRAERDQAVRFLIDAGRLMAAPLGPASRLDVVLDAMAVVAVTAEALDDRVGVVAFADRTLVQVRPRRAGAGDALRSVAGLQTVPVDADYERVFRTVAGEKRSLMVVFTDLLDTAAARSLTRAVPVMARRHAVIVASAADPDMDDLTSRAPSTPTDVYAASVALQIAADRALASRRLASAGATVVDAAPPALGSACAAAYLGLKRRGRL